MRGYCCALLVIAALLVPHRSPAQTPVDVSRFDLAGIKLRMPLADVAEILKRLRDQDGGVILGEEELEKILKDYREIKENSYFGYSSGIYKIGVTLSPPYRVDGQSFPPSIVEVVYVIKDYKKESGARQQVLEKFGQPTFDNQITGEIQYCQRLASEGNSIKICDVTHGDTLFFVNGTLYLSDKDFGEFTKTHALH
jgi:hypothetical protein